MSVERREFEVRVNTPVEMAGMEEGAGELERAIGKAKALGRDFGRLARQLARAREGMRRFRLEHPGVGERGGEREETEERVEGKEMGGGVEEVAGKGGGRTEMGFGQGSTESSTCAEATVDRRPAEVEEGWEGTTRPRPEAGGIPEGQEASRAGAGTEESPGADWAESDGAGPGAPGWSDREQEAAEGIENRELRIGKSGREKKENSQFQIQDLAAQRALLARREVEEMVREAMAEREMAQPGREKRQEEAGRMAAVETRLRRLEERARMNRDGG
jgi:hypothetical protein